MCWNPPHSDFSPLFSSIRFVNKKAPTMISEASIITAVVTFCLLTGLAMIISALFSRVNEVRICLVICGSVLVSIGVTVWAMSPYYLLIIVGVLVAIPSYYAFKRRRPEPRMRQSRSHTNLAPMRGSREYEQIKM